MPNVVIIDPGIQTVVVTEPQATVIQVSSRFTFSGGAGAVALNDLTDVTLTTPASGQLLRYNGTVWVNYTLTSGDLPSHTHTASEVTDFASAADARIAAASIDDLADVALSGTASGDFLRHNGSAWVNTPAATPNVQIFNADGTWTKPAGAKLVHVICLGGGGGGGSGRRADAGTRYPGGGGGGGAICVGWFPESVLSSTEAVVIGAGGAGGAGQTSDTNNGLAGSNGSPSSFGSLVSAQGGAGGAAGTSISISAVQADIPGHFFGSRRTTISSTTGVAGLTAVGGPSGGTGGGLDSAGTAYAGGAGGVNASVGLTGGTAGTVGGGNGGSGNTNADIYYATGTGGGGGGSSNLSDSGNGGTGGRGAGGGGGAASINGVTTGDGGTGGFGRVVVITYF